MGILVVFLAVTGTMLLTGSSLGTLVRDLGSLAAAAVHFLQRRLLHAGEPGAGPAGQTFASDPDDDFPAPAPLTAAAGAALAADPWGEEPVAEPEPAAEEPVPATR